jgi:phosphate transport system substrate-binding protein
MKPAEREETKKNTGKDPVDHLVAYDALSIYVHKANPLAKITRSQLACIYGEGAACGKWSDLGVEVPGCSGQEIVRVSRQNNSGTYAYFREWVLGEGKDFKLGSRDMSGSKDVSIRGRRRARRAQRHGYHDEVKTVCWRSAGDPCVALDGGGAEPHKLSRPLTDHAHEPTGESGLPRLGRSDAGRPSSSGRLRR